MTVVWLVVFLLLVILEFATINLVSIWFALGALVSFFVSLYVDNTTIQVAIFVIVSFLSILLTRKFVQKLRTKKPERVNLDSVIGKIGTVTEKSTRYNPGEVKVGGKRWTAISEESIEKDSHVKILAIDGVKLVVEKSKTDE